MLARRLRAASGNRGGVPTDGLVAWYTMDNISGSTLVDEMGNYDGTIYGSVPTVAGVDGFALQPDTGIDNYVEVPSTLFDAIRTQGSITAAVYKPAGQAVWVLNARSAAGGSRQQINVTKDGRVSIDEYQGVKSESAAGVVPDNAWSLVTWSWDASGRRAWVGTAEVTLSNSTGVFSYPAQGAVALLNHWYYIDNNISTSGGAVDQMRVYSRPSTQADVNARYDELF